MNTFQIDSILKRYKVPNYLGVFAKDKIPRGHNKGLMVVNQDPANRGGSHWFCIFINDNGPCEFFDSFGRPPPAGRIKNYMDKNCRNGWIYNNVQLQSVTSSFCGHYCVLYCVLRGKNIVSLRKFVSLFTRDTAFNDLLVNRMLKSMNKRRKL